MNTIIHRDIAGHEARVLAVLLLLLALSLALFSDVFRFGRDRGRAPGQLVPVDQGNELCDWFTTR